MTGPCITPWSTLQPQRYEPGPSIDLFVAEVKNRADDFSVQQNILSDYAQTIVHVARIIKEGQYDVILCPLRGARHPVLQANINVYGRAVLALRRRTSPRARMT